ncbi:MAG: hypothetical protein K8F62_11745, partial [Pseudorhodoplanes sp.]|nr:hypothetical protein [Pseudorhodoplanes sp.]
SLPSMQHVARSRCGDLVRLRTVLIGFGHAAATFGDDPFMARWFPKASHLQCLLGHEGFELVGIADTAESARVRARSRLPGVVVTNDTAELAKLQPVVAVLAIPPQQRLAAIEALPDLRGIMLEKPLGLPAVRDPLVAVCARRNIIAQVHFWRRGDPAMRDLGGGALIHRIGVAQAAFGLYGNGLRNNGSHLIDLVRMLLGPITAVRATSAFVHDPTLPLPGDGQLGFVLDLQSGAAVAVQAVDFRHYREVALDIWGTVGRLAVMQEGLSISEYSLAENRGLANEREIASDRPAAIQCMAGAASPALYDNLAAALDGTARLLSPLSSACETERVIDGLIASAISGGACLKLEAGLVQMAAKL